MKFLKGDYRHRFLTKSENRSKTSQRHIDEISKVNKKIAQMEIIKERFHDIFECQTMMEAQPLLHEAMRWAASFSDGSE